MALFTADEVKQAASDAAGVNFTDLLEDANVTPKVENYFQKQASESERIPVTHFDIFLSHAYTDRVAVLGVFVLLKATGFSVYVDWIHDRNRLDRTKVTAANANILRKRMHQCKSLLYTTTANHTTSKWMPWECGYFDGYDSESINHRHQEGHVAILPVVQAAGSIFTGQEYLSLYPIAQKGIHSHRNLNIHNQSNPSLHKHFDQWIKYGNP